MNVIANEFNALANEYETNRLARWYKAHAEQILEQCPPLENGDILDVGCGTGYLLRSYLKRNPGTRGLGLDIAEAMVERATQLASSEAISDIRFVQGDWESLDDQVLDNRSFRLVFCTNAFHYFSNPQRAADKLFDVLSVDGYLYVLERNASNSLLTRLWGWMHRHCIKDNVEFYTSNKLESLFRQAGFSKVTVLRTINRFLWKNKLYTSIVIIKCKK